MKNRMPLVLALLLAVLVVFTIHSLDFPGSVPNFERLSGGGVLLDVKPSFSEVATYQRLSDYGEGGRNNYVFRNLTVDVLLPLAVFPALFLLMLHALRGSSLGTVPKAFLYSLPFVYVIFDLAENGTVLALLAYFPDRMHLIAGILPYITVIKRTASLLALAVPLVIFSVALIRKALAKA
jgi:hypothetical protein